MINIDGIYFPPLFIAIIMAVAITLFISAMINYCNVSKYIWHPALFYVLLVTSITTTILLTHAIA